MQKDFCHLLHVLPAAQQERRRASGGQDPFPECLLHKDVHWSRVLDQHGTDSPAAAEEASAENQEAEVMMDKNVEWNFQPSFMLQHQLVQIKKIL